MTKTQIFDILVNTRSNGFYFNNETDQLLYNEYKKLFYIIEQKLRIKYNISNDYVMSIYNKQLKFIRGIWADNYAGDYTNYWFNIITKGKLPNEIIVRN